MSPGATAMGVTASLLRPPPRAVVDEERVAVRDRLVASLPALADGFPEGRRPVVDGRLLRLARRGPPAPGSPGSPDEPFRWRSGFTRRSLGLAAIAACRAGRFRTPGQALPVVADEAVADWAGSGRRRYGWEAWYSGLAVGGRAAVLADAATWAASLWTALDWERLPGGTRIGGPDEVWSCGGRNAVVVKGRADVRIPLGDGSCALVVVHPGVPDGAWSTDTGLAALVGTLRAPGRASPSRLAGLWPEAGMHMVLDVDAGLLTATANAVLAAVAMVGDPSPSREHSHIPA